VAQGQGGATIAGALILGAAILGGSFWIHSGLERASSEIASLRDAIETAPTPSPRGADRARGPDPRRRYSVNTEGAPVRGDEDAKLTIVEFSDFQCPFCRRVNPTLAKILEEYGDKVKIVFKHLPLSIHPKAPAAHAAAEAAHRQGKFWPMHDRIFADQAAMSPEKYLEYAQELGLDMERFQRDLNDPAIRQRIESDSAEGASLGVSGTPAFFVNGRFLSGAQPYPRFQALIDEELGRG